MRTALGLANSVSQGILSAIRFDSGATWYQTEAAINPGNSGGPLIDAATGALVGIVSWGFRDTEGLGFAVSVRDALRVLGVRLR